MKRKSSEPDEMLPFNLMVLRSRCSKRVLYVECGKDFVDMLFCFLTKPIRKVLKLLDDGGLLADANKGLFCMYKSLKTFGPSTLDAGKEVLFGAGDSSFENVFLSDPVAQGSTCIRPYCTKFLSLDKSLCGNCHLAWVYRCRQCERKGALVSDGSIPVRCNYCPQSSGGPKIERTLKVDYELEAKPEQPQRLVTSDSKSKLSCKEKGFVKNNVTFMVNEDLSISTGGVLKSMSLLQTSMQIDNWMDLDIREISVGEHEVLLLVRAALISETPLTEVFGPLFDSD